MIAVIGEKPKRGKGYCPYFRERSEKQEVATFQVTGISLPGVGHLVGLAMPEAYGIQSFRRESLP